MSCFIRGGQPDYMCVARRRGGSASGLVITWGRALHSVKDGIHSRGNGTTVRPTAVSSSLRGCVLAGRGETVAFPDLREGRHLDKPLGSEHPKVNTRHSLLTHIYIFNT